MKVLRKGGSGFNGSNLALKLIEKGYCVVLLDNLSSQIHGNNPDDSYTYNLIKNKCKLIVGDVTNSSDWKKALKDIDIVVHLAAETGTGQSMYQIEKYVDVNISGTAKMMETIKTEQCKVKKIIIASSRAVYGEGKYLCMKHGIIYPSSRNNLDMSNKDFEVKCPICNQNVEMLPTDEDSKLHPTSVYGYTKKAQEELCMIIGKTLKIPIIAFRFQNVYGPGQSLKNPYTGILSIFSTRIKNNNDLNIFEDGLETRDFVYIDDVTNAIILGIESENANFESFNVGSNEKVDVLTVANILKHLYDSKINISISGNYRLGDIRHNFADLSKIKLFLGYEPEVNFNLGISKLVAWVEQQSIEIDTYDTSIDELKKKGLYK
jgi:dTDP-L-rhamnose 4-epimerase